MLLDPLRTSCLDEVDVRDQNANPCEEAKNSNAGERLELCLTLGQYLGIMDSEDLQVHEVNEDLP